jgi:6,7-dimethyl-8-ribityllumazine synthase
MHVPFGELGEKEKKKILYGVPGTFEIPYVGKHDDGKIHKARYE